DNTIFPEFTKSISKNYCEAFFGFSDTIRLYKAVRPVSSPSISATIKQKFESVFSHVSTEHLSIPSAHDLQIYALKFDDFDFDYHVLQKYLRSNIGYYLYSRLKIEKYIDEDDTGAISYDAVEDMKKIISKIGVQPGDKLDEILLYVFLEAVLNAPKLMSEAEIRDFNGTTTSSSDGIHLLTLETSPPSCQLVFGSAIIDGNLCEAIDKAFAKAEMLKNNKNNERRFVTTHALSTAFSQEMREQLTALLVPSETSIKQPESAFGFFMGYSLNHVPKEEKSIGEYQTAVLAQIKSDIEQNLDAIEDAVRRHGLNGYSMYIYLLPFADADKDKRYIMNRLLQIGEDAG
ncbi:MAG: DUF1837 domain-containing protein, partial [Schwartzia sp.]|nr:DUF1837 domain-containing protein [Schwartzia sp. (in: firmicutes)]